MILWALARVALAEPVDAVDEATTAVASEELPASEVERLLGPPPPDVPDEVSPLPVIDAFSWWPLLFAAAGAGAVWWMRRRLEASKIDGGSELRVVGRADLGAQSGLAVVEVRDRQGTWRRLVIGTGGGSPQLVADLGEPQFGLLGEDEDSTVEEITAHTPPSRSIEGDLPHDFEGYDPLPSPSEAGLPPLPADPRSGRALVHEVLGERRRRGRTKRPPGSFQTFA